MDDPDQPTKVQITNHAWFQNRRRPPGYGERNRHIALIQAGARCLMVICDTRNPPSTPRKIARFDDRNLLVGGMPFLRHGETWIAVEQTITVHEFLESQLAPSQPARRRI